MKKMFVALLLGTLFAPIAKANDQLPSWSEIESDPRLYAHYPQVTFKTPDNGVRYSNVNDLCETTVNGVEIVRDMSPYTPCALSHPVGGSARGCIKYGKPVLLERAKNYRGEVCQEYGQIGRSFGCTRSEMQNLSIASTYLVSVYRRVNDHDNGFGYPALFRKNLTLPSCN